MKIFADKKAFVLYGILLCVIVQISIVDIFIFKSETADTLSSRYFQLSSRGLTTGSSYISRNDKTSNQNVFIVNKIATGLTIPFVQKQILQWHHFTYENNIIFVNKQNKISYGKILNLPSDIILIDGKRQMIPEGYYYTTEFCPHSCSNAEMIQKGFLNAKNILGKIIFML